MELRRDFCFLALEKIEELQRKVRTPLDAGSIRQCLFRNFGLNKYESAAILRLLISRGLILKSRASKKYHVNKAAFKICKRSAFYPLSPTESMHEKPKIKATDREALDEFIKTMEKASANPEIQEAVVSTVAFLKYVFDNPDFASFLMDGMEKVLKEEESKPKAKQEMAGKMFCKGCGIKIDADSKFCQKCGVIQ